MRRGNRTAAGRARFTLALLAGALLVACAPPPQITPGQSCVTSTTGGACPSVTLTPTSPSPSGPVGYAAVVLADEPVAYWRLDDDGGQATDVGGRYPGRYEGSPERGASLVGEDDDSAPRLEGRERITADALASGLSWSSFSLEIWVEVTETEEEDHAIAFSTADGGQAPAILRDEPTDLFKYRDGESGGVEALSTTVPEIGGIYHLVATVDEFGRGTLYVNGRAEAIFETDRRPPDDGLFTIGAEYDEDPLTVTSYWQGRLDEPAVYDHALSAKEVAAHYRAGQP